MILIPQKLFEAPNVHTIFRDGNTCILNKELDRTVLEREGYISNHVVSIVLAGEQRIFTYDDSRIHIKSGEVLFMPRGIYYVSDLLPQEGTFNSLLFYFDNAIIHEFLANTQLTNLDRTSVPDHLKFGNVSKVQLFASQLLEMYSSQSSLKSGILKLKILELIHLLNDLSKPQQFANFLFQLTLPQKRNIKSFMEKNFSKPLKIEDYAYLTGRSISTFRRDFKSFYNTTPQQWLKEKRLKKAIQILNHKEISVTQLAYEVGYENISYFIKEFKKKVGQSPKQYMKVMRDEL